MKKCMFFVISLLSIGVSLWQTDMLWIKQNNLEPGQIKSINQDLHSDNMTDLGNLQSTFCNENKATRDLTLNLRPWQRNEICIAFTNTSKIAIPISFGFAEGSVSNDWVPKCQLTTTGNIFAKSIKGTISTGINIPANGSITQRFTYVANKNSSGGIFGCFGYEINKQETLKEGNLFLIIPRKVWYIQVNITWSVYNFWRLDDMKDTYTEKRNTIYSIIAAILALWILITIFQKDPKKEKYPSKK